MKRHLLPYTVSCCIMLILSVEIVLPQNFFYNFQTWDVKNGLSSNYCHAVVQDRKGYLYVGTDNGLYVFNGSRFRPLESGGRSRQLVDDNVEDLIIDQYQRLWFASIENGVGMVNLQERDFRIRYFKPRPDLDSLADTKVSKLCFDHSGNLWVGTRGFGLFKLDTLTHQFTYVATDNHNSLYNQHIRSFYLHTPDSLFVGVVNGLSIINPLTGAASHLDMRQEGHKGNAIPTVRKVVHWAKDSFLLATDRGTYWLHSGLKNLSSLYTDAASNVDFKKINSNDIFRFSEEEIWIATENQGISFFNIRTQRLQHSYKMNELRSGISRGFINRFYSDVSGNIWIAQQNGLSLFQAKSIRFNNFSFSDGDLLAGVLVPGRDELLCFRNNSITRISTLTGNVSGKQISTIGRSRINPTCVLKEPGNNYLLFIRDSFFMVNANTLETRLLPLKKEKVDSTVFNLFRVIRCVDDTLNGRRFLLLLTKTPARNILFRYFPDDGSLSEFTIRGLEERGSGYHFSGIKKVGRGKYWISTLNSGIFYIDNVNPPVRYAATEKDGNRKIPGGEIRDFILTDAHNLWLLIQKIGLVHLSMERDAGFRYKIYADAQGLSDKRLYSMIADSKGDFWITTNSRIFCFDRQKKQFIKYSAVNGLGNIIFGIDETNAVVTENGFIGFSDQTTNITWFKPPEKNIDPEVRLILNVVNVGDQLFYARSAAGDQLKFLPHQNNLLFQYDVIDYDKTSYYQVLLKLEGMDAVWYPASDNTEQRYMNLPPGNYAFRMKLRYGDGRSSPEQVVFFSIATIWYKTWWFRIAAMLLLAASLYWLVRDLMNRKLAKQKTAMELEQALKLERARISAELHDDIGGGLSTIRILSETNKYFSPAGLNIESLDKISTHSKELLQKMTEIVWSLNIKNDSLEQLITYIRYHTVKQFDEVNLLNRFEIPEDIPSITVEGIKRRHIQLLVKESINNIIRHADASFVKASISISDRLVFTIHDNGKGIHFNSSTRGNGLGNIKSHAEAVHGTVVFENNNGTMMRFSVLLKNLR